MKKLILLHIILILLIHCMFIGNCYAQNTVFHFIRSYNNTLTLSCDEKQYDSFLFNRYGWLQYGNVSKFRYLYTAQEYDFELDIHFFQSRLYNPQSTTFLQPDPQSQYHSAYTYVNGDPVNFIDTDGNIGKPLILYGEQIEGSNNIAESTKDLLDAVPDSYQYPLSNFVNGEIPDLPEWNGNVFIKTHMSPIKGRELVLEEALEKGDLKTPSSLTTTEFTEDKLFRRSLDGDMMGSMLRRFSEERGVPIKNITAGGCEGSYAANSMRGGYVRTPSSTKLGFREIKFTGLNQGKATMYVGKESVKKLPFKEKVQLKETKIYVGGVKEECCPKLKHSWGNKVKFKGVVERATPESDWKLLPYTDEAGIQDFVNGRVPDNFAKDFTTIISKY